MDRAFKAFHQVLAYAGLYDRHDKVSITQVACLALLARTLAAPSWPLVSALIGAFLLYAHKRHENAKAAAREVQQSEAKVLAERVEALAKLQEGVAAQASETKKQQEEVKKLLSSSVLVNSFKPPVRRSQTHVG